MCYSNLFSLFLFQVSIVPAHKLFYMSIVHFAWKYIFTLKQESCQKGKKSVRIDQVKLSLTFPQIFAKAMKQANFNKIAVTCLTILPVACDGLGYHQNRCTNYVKYKIVVHVHRQSVYGMVAVTDRARQLLEAHSSGGVGLVSKEILLSMGIQNMNNR